MRVKTPQELYWEGTAGKEWFSRNEINPESRRPLFRDIMSKTFGVQTICELGCGQGHNLLAISQLSKNYRLTGVEPNSVAIEKLSQHSNIARIQSFIHDWSTTETFDLVFACGVLIHIDDALPLTYTKIDSLSRRYVLFCEYFNPVPVEVSYHGQSGLLIKRDFAREFLELMNGKYSVVDYGFVWRQLDPAWDNINWTLMEKPEE